MIVDRLVYAATELINPDVLERGVRIGLTLMLGIPAVYLLSRVAQRLVRRRGSAQTVMLVRKAALYGGFLGLLGLVLPELGFKLGPLLGAAGVVGVAVGFASQTSVSNIISGVFLIWEKAFAVGDTIEVDGLTGIVLSIDLLSVKLRLFDNRFVRVPNEALIKSRVINITRFPIRRLDLNLGVAYKEDIGRVRRVLMEIAESNPLCLDEPAPVFIFQKFGDSALEVLFAVWFEKADMLLLRNSIMEQIKRRFDEEGIEIPFPQRTLVPAGSGAPFPVRLVPGVEPREPALAQPPSPGENVLPADQALAPGAGPTGATP